MKKYIGAFLLLIFMIQCTTSSKKTEKGYTENEYLVEFGNIEVQHTSLLKNVTFVKLETNDECLVGEIKQIEVFRKSIYILSDIGLYVFDLTGDFFKKIEVSGNGPGEFISPYSFWIDKDGFIFLLDRQLNRLQKYNIDDLNFIESIIMPYQSPIGFAKIPKSNLFIYYYPLRPNKGIERNQVFIADRNGEIQSKLFEGDPSGKILHGNNSNFYFQDNDLKFYPYFSNNVYIVNTDTIYNAYTLSFENNNFPSQDIFTKHDNSGDIMQEIIFGDNKWIRFVYIYETTSSMIIKYYIERDFYIGTWNKISGETINFKYDNVIDNIGIGGKFPLPIGVYDEQIIGVINPYDISIEKVQNTELKKLMSNFSEEDNPILCFYSVG